MKIFIRLSTLFGRYIPERYSGYFCRFHQGIGLNINLNSILARSEVRGYQHRLPAALAELASLRKKQVRATVQRVIDCNTHQLAHLLTTPYGKLPSLFQSGQRIDPSGRFG